MVLLHSMVILENSGKKNKKLNGVSTGAKILHVLSILALRVKGQDQISTFLCNKECVTVVQNEASSWLQSAVTTAHIPHPIYVSGFYHHHHYVSLRHVGSNTEHIPNENIWPQIHILKTNTKGGNKKHKKIQEEDIQYIHYSTVLLRKFYISLSSVVSCTFSAICACYAHIRHSGIILTP